MRRPSVAAYTSSSSVCVPTHVRDAHREKSPLKQLSTEEEASIDVLVTCCEFELHTQVDPRDEQLHPMMAPVKRTSLKP